MPKRIRDRKKCFGIFGNDLRPKIEEISSI